jgi:hypothetical protein
VDGELNGLPEPNFNDPRREVLTLLRDFSKMVSKHIEGLPPSHLYDPRNPASFGLMHLVNEAFERFQLAVDRTAPQFRPWSSKLDLTPTQENLMIAAASEDSAGSAAHGPIFYIDTVMDLAKRQVGILEFLSSRSPLIFFIFLFFYFLGRSRTRELPGNYPFSVKESLIVESVKQWQALADMCFEEVQDIVITIIDQLVEEQFAHHEHGGLLDAVV